MKIWRIINDTLFFLCSKKKLFNTESDVEEDKKTVKAVLEDQHEFYNVYRACSVETEIGKIYIDINTESDVKEDEKTVKAVLEDQR